MMLLFAAFCIVSVAWSKKTPNQQNKKIPPKQILKKNEPTKKTPKNHFTTKTSSTTKRKP